MLSCVPWCRLTFLVAAALQFAATVASVLLWRRTAYIYAQELNEIQKEERIVERHPQTGMRLVRQRHAAADNSGLAE